MQVAERIREIREKKGLTQEELAQKMGLTQQMVSMLEVGKRKPSIEEVCQLADLGGTSVDWILGREVKNGNGNGSTYLHRLCDVFLAHDTTNTVLSDHLERTFLLLLEFMGYVEEKRNH